MSQASPTGPLKVTVRNFFPNEGFPTALAPMQDVTGLPFMSLISEYDSPDLFFTEYFRVHENARLDPDILSSITENSSGKPVFAQLIGEDLEHVARFARELQQYPVAGIDLNLGCPAPRVYRKNVGGGLLRVPHKIDQILKILRDACDCPLTVKTRIGFEDGQNFSQILDIFASNQIDLLSLHARTVKGGYRSAPDYSYVGQAVARLPCPVLLNGEVNTAEGASLLINQTGADGVMIGRSAIRNPWIFKQIRQINSGKPIFHPTMENLYDYIKKLYKIFHKDEIPEIKQVARLKKFLNFIGLSVDTEGQFLFRSRRVKSWLELDQLCQEFLLHDGKASQFLNLHPFEGLVARPSSEAPACIG
jgi:tRNA-dihydrouridine synthase B